MDTTLLAQSLGTGLAAGMVIMAVASIILIPASYMMNRFIYHNAFMRLLIGILSGAGSFFVFLFLLVKRWNGAPKAHYFGLIPLFKTGDGTGEDSGKMAFFTKIINLFTHPIMMFYETPTDVEGYESAIEYGLGLKEKGSAGTVPEDFFEATRKIAAIPKKAAWETAIKSSDLTAAGSALYGEVRSVLADTSLTTSSGPAAAFAESSAA